MDGIRPTSTLHAVFAQAAQRYPDRLAVVDPGGRLTYRELAARARAVAGALQAAGVRGGLVGLRADRGAGLVAGILGILMSGAAYVPMDPDLPADRVRYIAEDAGVQAVLAGDPGARADAAWDPGVPVLELGAACAHAPLAGPLPGTAHDLAYVIYTSGSTGLPKGVMVEHAQVLALFEAAEQVFDFSERDVWTLFHSFAFDFSVWELFGALLRGGTAVVVPTEATRSPAGLWRLIEREGVTVLNQTPTSFARLSRAGDGAGRALRYVILGGEALEFSRLRPWYDHHPEHGPALVNMYGITETTVHVTFRELTKADAADSRSLIGTPLPHLSVHVLGPGLEPLPAGEVGELCIGGAGLARGYLNRDDLTAQRFVEAAGQRLYRSGDLGRWLDGGELEYVGRLDDQVKVRGYRIELGEIQHWLRCRADVADVAVTTWHAPEAGQRLVAYLVPAEGCAMAPAEELRDYLSGKIPGYMIPSRFVFVPDLPVNHNGKLDRAALPDPGRGARQPAPVVAEAGPAGDRTAKLLAIWQKVLGYPDIQADDPFYAVGGDSIQAIRVAAAAEAEGMNLSVEDLMENPTVRGLAERGLAEREEMVRADERRTGRFSLLGEADRRAMPEDIEDAYPITPLQMAMLFYGDDPEARAYHSVSSATVNRPFDRERMIRCLQRIIARHEMLRTRFDLASFSVPLQLVQREAPVRLAVDDLSGAPPGAQEAAVASLLDQERAEPLDWEAAPMIRFRAAPLSDARFVFVWSEHHAILDGWSSNLLFSELMEAYEGLEATGSAAALPPVRDYVAAELDAIASPEHREFWAGYLRGAQSAGPARPVRDGAGSGMQEIAIPAPPKAHELLRGICRAAGLTPKALLMAVAATALAVDREADEVIVGHVTHGRLNRPGADEVLGMFLNTIPLRASVSGSFLDIAGRIAGALNRSGPYRRYPLAHIQRAAGTGHLLDNMVNVVDFHQLDSLARSGLIGADGVRNSVRTSIPLVIEACRMPASDELAVSVQFQGDEWNAARRAAFTDTLTSALARALRNPREKAVRNPREEAVRNPREEAVSPGKEGTPVPMTGPRAESLVVLDNVRSGAASTLHDLLCGEPAYLGDVRYLDPLDPFDSLDLLGQPWQAGSVPSLRERAVALADALGHPGAEPYTLVAHCTNTALACQLAAVLAQRGAGPRRLVAFAPVFVNAEVVRSHVRDLMVTLGVSEEMAAAFSSEAWPDGLTDPSCSLASTVAALHRAAMAQARELALDADEAGSFAALLTGQYERWLTHLAGHIGCVACEPRCPVLVVGSSVEDAVVPAGLIAPAVDARGYEFARPTAFAEPGLRRFFDDLLHDVPATDGGRR